MRTSVLQPWWPYSHRIPPDATCWLCGGPAECRHHVYPGATRRACEQNGLWVYLCNRCHNMSGRSVHMDRDIDSALRRACQAAFERGDPERHDLFMSLVGRSYL